MKKTKMEKGITLVALIITIVVLLILAVVAITAIRNDNIINYANNAAEGYENEKGLEEGKLGGYEDVLSQYSNQLAAGGIGGSSSTGETTTSSPSLSATSKEGDLVTLKDKDGVEHQFYVLEVGDTTIKLLTKECINTETLTQTTPNAVPFSTTNYWVQMEGITYPYDLTEVTEADIALKAAADYGQKFEGAIGRLMTGNEWQTYEVGFKYNVSTWLCTVSSSLTGGGINFGVIGVGGPWNFSDWNPEYETYVCPLLIIYKSAISK